MKRGFLISLSVHLGLLTALFGPLGSRTTVLPAGLVYEVSLVSLPAGSPGPAGPPPGTDEQPDATLATPKTKKEAKKETLKIPEEKKTLEQKVTPEDKEVSPEPAGTEKTPPADSEPELHSLVKGGTGSGVGGSVQGGFSSQLQLDIENFEFSYYLLAVRNKVSSNWNPPAGLVTPSGAVRAVIFFRILRDGKISDLKIESPSSVGIFDQSALRAILRSEPFPPLPRGFADGSLGVHFGFEYVK